MNAVPRPTLPVGRSRLVFVAVLGGVSAIGPLATDLYLPAMPKVAADLGASQQSIALTVTAFLFGLALGQLVSGHLSDSYGRRRPLLAGMLVFSLASLACTATTSAGLLIALRGVQGFAGAAGIAIANAVVADHTRGAEAARLLSRLALVTYLMPIVAPLVGAQILAFTSWRGVFVVQGAAGLLLAAGVLFGLRESLPRQRRMPFSFGATAGVMRRLSGDRAFMGLAFTSAFLAVGFFTYLSGSSFVVQGVYEASPTAFSLLFAANAVGMLTAIQLNHFLLSRSTPQRLLRAGLAVGVAAGLSLLGVTLVGGLGIVAWAIPLFVFVAVVGFTGPDATALALSLHTDAAGSASALFGTLRMATGALGGSLIALAGDMSGLPMAAAIAGATLAAAATFSVVAARVDAVSAVLDMPEEAAADAPVG